MSALAVQHDAVCSGCAKSSLGTPMNSAIENASESSCLSAVLQKLPAGGKTS